MQAWVRKCGHAQTGTCRWVQGGCGCMGGCMQVTIVNISRKKKKKHLPTGTGRQAGIGKSGCRVRKHGHAQTGACRWVQGGVWRHGWVHAGYNHEHKQKEKKRKAYLLAQVGRHRHRQIGRHRQEWAWGKKHGHAQTGTCGWAQEGCGGTGGHMQVTIINTSRKKRKEKLIYWHRWAGDMVDYWHTHAY